MKTKSRNTLIVAIALVSSMGGTYGWIRQSSRLDVLEICAQVEPNAPVEIEYLGTHLSLHHGILARYKITGLSELDKAAWYLIPWRDVALTK